VKKKILRGQSISSNEKGGQVNLKKEKLQGFLVGKSEQANGMKIAGAKNLTCENLVSNIKTRSGPPTLLAGERSPQGAFRPSPMSEKPRLSSIKSTN